MPLASDDEEPDEASLDGGGGGGICAVAVEPEALVADVVLPDVFAVANGDVPDCPPCSVEASCARMEDKAVATASAVALLDPVAVSAVVDVLVLVLVLVLVEDVSSLSAEITERPLEAALDDEPDDGGGPPGGGPPDGGPPGGGPPAPPSPWFTAEPSEPDPLIICAITAAMVALAWADPDASKVFEVETEVVADELVPVELSVLVPAVLVDEALCICRIRL